MKINENLVFSNQHDRNVRTKGGHVESGETPGARSQLHLATRAYEDGLCTYEAPSPDMGSEERLREQRIEAVDLRLKASQEAKPKQKLDREV